MLPAISKNKLAHFIDVFLDGLFTVAEQEQIMNAGVHFGLKPKFM
jgi:imidazolonepropionase